MALFDFLSDNWPLFLGPLLGLVAIYTLLPGPKRRPAMLGVGAGLAALLLGGFIVARAGAITGVEMGVEVFLFYVFALVAVLGGAMLITQHHPARAALSFAVVVLATCGLFLLQAGPFLTVATIIVYAGAIIVTFLFVLMLAQQEGLSNADARSREPFLSSLTGFLLLCALLYVLKVTYKPDLDHWVNRSEEYLKQIQALNAKDKPTLEEKRKLFRDLEEFRVSYDRWLRNQWTREQSEGEKGKAVSLKLPPPGGKLLGDALANAGDLNDALPTTDAGKAERRDVAAEVDFAKLEKKYLRVYEVGKDTRNDPLLGSFKPNTTRLSEFSGPRSSRATAELRRDEEGRPQMPAENTVYLGRSLFTDYLLAVELAGMLLLVATVGAIAISSRKLEGKKPAATPAPAPRRIA